MVKELDQQLNYQFFNVKLLHCNRVLAVMLFKSLVFAFFRTKNSISYIMVSFFNEV